MKWFLEAVKKYAVFNGRARRKEYWYFFLFYLLIYIALSAVDGVAGSLNTEEGIGLLGGLFAIGMLLPSLGVAVRRLHDINRSGWWLLLSLIPIIGSIVILVFAVQDSQPGDNQYGPNPKTDAA